MILFAIDYLLVGAMFAVGASFEGDGEVHWHLVLTWSLLVALGMLMSPWVVWRIWQMTLERLRGGAR